MRITGYKQNTCKRSPYTAFIGRILDNVPRKGFIVKSFSRKEISELYVLIGYLDGLAAELACPDLTEKMFKDMQFYIDSMEIAINSKNYEIYLQQQELFHQIYINECGNDMLIDVLGKLKNKFLRQDYLDDPQGNTFRALKETNAEHRKLLEFLENGRGKEASEFLYKVHWAPEKSDLDMLVSNEEPTV